MDQCLSQSVLAAMLDVALYAETLALICSYFGGKIHSHFPPERRIKSSLRFFWDRQRFSFTLLPLGDDVKPPALCHKIV